MIKKQGVTTGPAGEKLSAEEMDQKRRDILSKIRQEEFDLQGGEASIAGFDHVKLR